MSLSQFVEHQDGTPLHSSVYAQVAHGDQIGSTKVQPFGERLHLERNRQAVRGYGSSLIGGSYMKEAAHQRLNTGVPRGETARPAGMRPSIPQRPTFRESPTRYNPYG